MPEGKTSLFYFFLFYEKTDLTIPLSTETQFQYHLQSFFSSSMSPLTFNLAFVCLVNLRNPSFFSHAATKRFSISHTIVPQRWVWLKRPCLCTYFLHYVVILLQVRCDSSKLYFVILLSFLPIYRCFVHLILLVHLRMIMVELITLKFNNVCMI